jgi:xanthine dehydrogenase YagR molybdenum-binding subunit
VLDLPEGNAMRAPGEAPGLMALEIAMDEMAEKLGMDPIEFRMINDTQVDPANPGASVLAAPTRAMPARSAPSASAGTGAMPGPGRRARRPLAGRHGRGGGLPQQPHHEVGRARPARRRGMVTVETDMTDIGTGSYTIIAQTAAEMMGVPLDKVWCGWAIRRSRSRPARAGSGAPTARPPACTPRA